MKRFKVQLINQRGMSLMQMVVALGLSSMVLVIFATIMQGNFIYGRKVGTEIEKLNLYSEISRTVTSDAELARSLNADATFKNCSEGTAACPKAEQPLEILNADGTSKNNNADNRGFNSRGESCILKSGSYSSYCSYKLKYFYSVVCDPSVCSGRIDVNVRAQLNKIEGTGANEKISLFRPLNRFLSINTATGGAPSGLALISTFYNIFYHSPLDGSLVSMGGNKDQMLDPSVSEGELIFPKVLVKDKHGQPIFAKTVASNGSSHTHVVRTDGSLWGAGNNNRGDLGVGGSMKSHHVGDFLKGRVHHLQAGSQVRIQTGAAEARSGMYVVENSPMSWQPVAGPLGDASIAQVKTAVAATNGLTIVIRENGEVWGIGGNAYNRMGFPLKSLSPGTPTYKDPYGVDVPYKLFWNNFQGPNKVEIATASADELSALGLLLSGSAKLFGESHSATHPLFQSNASGQQDNTPGFEIEVPSVTLVPKKSFYLGKDMGFEVLDIVISAHGGCAINQHKNVVCWGAPKYGFLGRGTLKPDVEWDKLNNVGVWSPGNPVPRVLKYLYVFSMSGASPVGTNPYRGIYGFQSPWDTGGDELPDLAGKKESFHRVKKVDGSFLENVREIAGGGNHTCAIDVNDRLYCWGRNWGGQLGRGFRCNFGGRVRDFSEDCLLSDRAGEVLIAPGVPLTNVREVHVSLIQTFAVTKSGELYAWGYQGVGRHQLGISDLTVTRAFRFAQLMTGFSGKVVHFVTDTSSTPTSCLINDRNELWCWGENAWGTAPTKFKFINGGDMNYPRPQLVEKNFTSI